LEIDPQTGSLFVARPLAHERCSSYELTVAVRGQTNQPLKPTDSTVIRIEILDTNNNAPMLLKNPLILEVAENFRHLPIKIGQIESVDLDEGQNAKLSFSIIRGNVSFFGIDSSTGEIILNGVLDRESIDGYNLTVEVADSGKFLKFYGRVYIYIKLIFEFLGFPRLSTLCEVYIKVFDMNDNSPKFVQPYYRVEMEENAPIGTFLVQVLATDDDIGENAKLK